MTMQRLDVYGNLGKPHVGFGKASCPHYGRELFSENSRISHMGD